MSRYFFSCNTKITSCFLYQEHNKTANFFAVKKKGLGRVIILHIVHVMRRSFDKKNSPKMLWVCIFFSRKIPKKKSWKQSAFLYFKLRFFCVFHRRIDKISECGDRSKNCVNLWEWGVLLSVWGFYFCIKFCSMLSILFTLFVFCIEEGGDSIKKKSNYVLKICKGWCYKCGIFFIFTQKLFSISIITFSCKKTRQVGKCVKCSLLKD